MKATLIAALFFAIALIATGAGGTRAAFAQATQKTIQDAGEYNAYMAAFNTSDPAAKAAAMEAFAVKYPASVVLTDALEQAMAAYQQAGNAPKVESTARRLLALGPDNIRALAILAFIERTAATAGDAQALAAMREHAARGLRLLPVWEKPSILSDADFAKLHAQVAAVLEGASGFGFYRAKDYAAARKAYIQALAADNTSLQDTYQLGIVEMEMSPLDATGFWHLAKAAALTKLNTPAHDSIENYAKAQYRKYHGSIDGWDAIEAAAATQAALPVGFVAGIKRAPAPAEIAVKAVADNDPATLSLRDWEYVLGFRDASPANTAAAQKVWAAIQSKQRSGAVKLRLPVTVISATANTIDGAITDENIKAKKADLHVVMTAPMQTPPVPGAVVNVTGVLTDYRPSPFLFTMTKGQL